MHDAATHVPQQTDHSDEKKVFVHQIEIPSDDALQDGPQLAKRFCQDVASHACGIQASQATTMTLPKVLHAMSYIAHSRKLWRINHRPERTQ